MVPPDDLEEYLRGDSALSRQYKREAAPAPPPALDRHVLRGSGAAPIRSPYLAPLALAASVFLSMALVLAIVFGPQPKKHTDEAPHLVRVAAHSGAAANAPLDRKLRLYSSDPPHTRTPSAWLADIAALRRAGRNNEADAESRRFRAAYPGYSAGEPEFWP
ncbi:MAG TPA: hypothetical protein VGE92_07625 [Steroidobacteraceae bacterium]|jgi:hypothetical protein